MEKMFKEVLTFFIVENFEKTISVLSLLVTIISLIVTYFSIRRDKGQFELNIYLGETWARNSNGNRVKNKGNYLCVTLANTGTA